MSKKTIYLLLILIICVLVLISIYIFIFQPGEKSEKEDKGSLIGGQRDEHGCLTSAGYTWCEEKQKCLRIFEEFCSDNAKELINDITQETGVVFNYNSEINFNWAVENNAEITEVTIPGVTYTAMGLRMSEVEKMEDYLNSITEFDSYNLADGVISGSRGYYYQYMACSLNFQYANLKQNFQGLEGLAEDNINVDFTCGYFNPNAISELIVQEEIKELFVEKYHHNPFEIKVVIGINDGVHIRGSVIFIKDGRGEGGNFFAVKQNDKWRLVFDGNGGFSCQMLNQYGFLKDFQEGCY